MPILYEEYPESKTRRKAFAPVMDTQQTITISLAAGKGTIIDAHAIDATSLATITKAYPTQQIKAVVSVRNDGDDDYIWYTVTDKDTGAVIDQPIGTPFLKHSEVLVRTGAALTMPNKNWNWLIQAGHGQ